MSKTYVFLPPLRRPSGGLAVLHQVAAHLAALGCEAVLAPREAGHWQPEISAHLPVAGWAGLSLGPDDVWLVPEGWPGALGPGLAAGARCLVYCQNWAYMFSGLPEGLTLDRLALAAPGGRSRPVSWLGVSAPVSWYIGQALGRKPPILRPGIDLDLFKAPEAKPDGPVRVAYMPRKNKAQVQQAKALLETRLSRQGRTGAVVFEAVDGLPQPKVAEVLGRSHVFLATGFPEGCPLPPLEAMACGCLCVGCGGFGGWDYMRQAAGGVSGLFTPWWPLRDTPWGGNGLWTADADVAAMAVCLEMAVQWFESGAAELGSALDAARDTAAAYGLDRQRDNVRAAWIDLGFDYQLTK